MAHIAIVTGLLTGRIHASFELVSRLRKEGHSVTYLCQPRTVEKISSHGFNCVPLPEMTFDYQDPRRKKWESSYIKKWIYHLRNWGSHYEQGKKNLKLEQHKRVLKEVGPDMLLIDVELHDIIFTAFELKIPIKLTTTWFSDQIGTETPPVRTSITPGKGLSGSKLGILLAWMFLRTKIYGRIFLNHLRLIHYRRFILKKYAREIGFPMSGLLPNTLPPLYSFTELPIVIMAMRELEFPHTPAQNLVYLGPMVYTDRVDFKVDEIDYVGMERIFKLREKGHQKLIYCCVGSLAQGDVTFLSRVIKAVEREKDWSMILSLGGNLSKADFSEVPPNVYLFPWVPQLKVLEKADLCINHSGNNTINECLHYKVPMVIYSMGYTDEDGTAARIGYHGLGIVGNMRKDTIKTIHQNIATVLADSNYGKAISQFHDIYEGYRQRKLSPVILS